MDGAFGRTYVLSKKINYFQPYAWLGCKGSVHAVLSNSRSNSHTYT